MSYSPNFSLDVTRETYDLRAQEAELVNTLRRAGVFAESIADVDPYQATLATKMVLDDISHFVEIGTRLALAHDSKNKEELDSCINELRAAILNQNLQQAAAISTRSYCSN